MFVKSLVKHASLKQRNIIVVIKFLLKIRNNALGETLQQFSANKRSNENRKKVLETTELLCLFEKN